MLENQIKTLKNEHLYYQKQQQQKMTELRAEAHKTTPAPTQQPMNVMMGRLIQVLHKAKKV